MTDEDVRSIQANKVKHVKVAVALTHAQIRELYDTLTGPKPETYPDEWPPQTIYALVNPDQVAEAREWAFDPDADHNASVAV